MLDLARREPPAHRDGVPERHGVLDDGASRSATAQRALERAGASVVRSVGGSDHDERAQVALPFVRGGSCFAGAGRGAAVRGQGLDDGAKLKAT